MALGAWWWITGDEARGGSRGFEASESAREIENGTGNTLVGVLVIVCWPEPKEEWHGGSARGDFTLASDYA